MRRTNLELACYTISVLCIVAGVILALAMIWMPQFAETLWRGLATVGVIFLGTTSVLSLSRTFERRSPIHDDRFDH